MRGRKRNKKGEESGENKDEVDKVLGMGTSSVSLFIPGSLLVHLSKCKTLIIKLFFLYPSTVTSPSVTNASSLT